jgi:catechol 2,3-dioxygenase-like lactoylglutathione lyase family enzyme
MAAGRRRFRRVEPAMRAILLAALLGLAVVPAPRAEPVPESERIPVDLRRTTLVVRDIDASLPLYRDGLGMKVIYDQRIGGGKNPDGSEKPATIRLVLLRANDTFIGALGLMQRLDIGPQPEPVFERAMPGDSILVFNAKDLDARWPTIKALPGVRVHTEPNRVEYPGPNGTTIPVTFTAVFDPDGNFIEINQLLGQAAGTVPAAESGSKKTD